MMNHHVTDLLDQLYEGVRDGHCDREMFGQTVLKLAEVLLTTRVRAAVIDHETMQMLIYAKNLPRC